MVVIAVDQIEEPKNFVAVGLFAAGGARPGGEDMFRAAREGEVLVRTACVKKEEGRGGIERGTLYQSSGHG